MTLKNAATFAFVAALLAAALLVWNFAFDVVNVLDGLIPLVKLVPAFLYALAMVGLATFLYVYRKTHS